MKKRSNAYWESRSNERMAEYHKDSNDVIYKINAAYDKAIKEINQDIDNIFYRFAGNGELTLDQAKRLLNQKIPNPLIKIYKRILPYIGNDDIKQWFITKINSRAYKARITRLEALKESIYANIKRVANVEVEHSKKLYINNLNKSYYRNTYDIQKGIGQIFDFSPLPGSFVEEILKSRWSGKNYSERIWDNNEVLAVKLEEVVTSGLMSGKSSRRMAKELEDMTMYGKFATERLIRTETTYITNQGEIESYKAAGIEEYIFLATLDLRTSAQCRAHDNKKYKVAEAVPGKNLPPLHPYCRSTTRAYLEGMKRGQRRARDPVTGKTYLIDNMSYEDWYQKFVVDKYGEQNAAKFEKMIKNKSSDKKQYENYKAVLGKDAPKTFDNFREMKYNNFEGYEDIKKYYSYKLDNPKANKINFEMKRELDTLGIKGTIHIPIKDLDLSNIGFDNQHINAEREHKVTKEEAISFINNSKVSISKWAGNYENYYSEYGVVYVDILNNKIRTAYKPEQFGDDIKSIMEVLKKYEK